MTQPIERVLVANRGEIAARILATCRARGLATIAVHSAVDADAPYVAMADAAVALPGAPVEAELDVDAIVAAAVDHGADAIHPGYGFLSENAALPRACARAGVRFIGPTAEVIELMGDKAAAKQAATDAGVPVLESFDPAGMSPDEVRDEVGRLGLPVLVKAVAGGGGKGMRLVSSLDALDDAVTAAAREASASFGDDRLLVERAVAAARHVEVQVAGDEHGGAVALFERDCSVQRRHQKVVEEAPSPALDDRLRARMEAAATDLVRAVGYTNLGTVEFLLDVGGDEAAFFFLEMNTRLQVEHPVTEAVTGLDLVGVQLDLAAGGHVPDRPDQPDGHAIEVRLYAEDPANGFLPQAGTLGRVAIGGDVRVDAGVRSGSVVSSHYDPMLAKVVAHGPDRETARRRLVAALGDSRVTGVVTNLGHLLDVLRHPAFVAGEVRTDFLPTHLPDWSPPPLEVEVLAATVAALAADTLAADGVDPGAAPATDPWAVLGPWRSAPASGWTTRLGPTVDEVWTWQVRTTPSGWVVTRRDDAHEVVVEHVRGPTDDGTVEVAVDGRHEVLVVERDGDHVWLSRPGHGSRRLAAPRVVRHVDHVVVPGAADLVAPMPGEVVAVEVEAGTRVARGAVLVVVEAMKMEHPVVAPGPGTVAALHVAVGDAVLADQVLVEVDVDDAPAGEPAEDA